MSKRSVGTSSIFILVLACASTSFAQGSAADTFKAKCSMCHGDDGLSNTPTGKALGVKSLRSPDVLKLSNVAMTAQIKTGKGKMPAFGQQLTDIQIKELVQYIHSLQKK